MASSVASLIERERVKRGWSYDELAEHLGVVKSTAHDWANGKHEPNLKSLRHIAKKLDVDLAEFLGAA